MKVQEEVGYVPDALSQGHLATPASGRGEARVYVDRGRGYSEQDAISLPVEQTGERQSFDFSLGNSEGIAGLRFDPLNSACVCEVHRLDLITAEGVVDALPLSDSNAELTDEHTFYFSTDDPQFILTGLGAESIAGARRLVVDLAVHAVGEAPTLHCLGLAHAARQMRDRAEAAAREAEEIEAQWARRTKLAEAERSKEQAETAHTLHALKAEVSRLTSERADEALRGVREERDLILRQADRERELQANVRSAESRSNELEQRLAQSMARCSELVHLLAEATEQVRRQAEAGRRFEQQLAEQELTHARRESEALKERQQREAEMLKGHREREDELRARHEAARETLEQLERETALKERQWAEDKKQLHARLNSLASKSGAAEAENGTFARDLAAAQQRIERLHEMRQAEFADHVRALEAAAARETALGAKLAASQDESTRLQTEWAVFNERSVAELNSHQAAREALQARLGMISRKTSELLNDRLHLARELKRRLRFAWRSLDAETVQLVETTLHDRRDGFFDAEESRSSIEVPSRQLSEPAAEIAPTERVSNTSELLDLYDETFVRTAYAVLLGREPDPAGLRHYLQAVRRGVPRIDVLRQIRRSPEGQSRQPIFDDLDTLLAKSHPTLWTRLGRVLQPSRTEGTKRLTALENKLHVVALRQQRREDAAARSLSRIQHQLDHLATLGERKAMAPPIVAQPVITETVVIVEEAPAARTPVPPWTLVPLNDLQPDAEEEGAWLSTGDDPNFHVSLEGIAPLAPGWYRIETAVGSERRRGSGRLYFNFGEGYGELDAIPLPYVSNQPVTRIYFADRPVVGIRFDPDEGRGKLLVGPLVLHATEESAAIVDMLARLGKYHHDYKNMAPEQIQSTVASLAAGAGQSPMGLLRSLYAETFQTRHSSVDYVDWIETMEVPLLPTPAAARATLAKLKHRPLISVIVPVYNTPEALLRACIDSVLAQVYPDFEICIADDSSTEPHVQTVLKAYQAQDARVKVVFRSSNGHISEASNSALEVATGDFVALLDHDDLLAAHALYYVALTLDEHPDAAVLYSDEDKIDEEGARFQPHFKSDWNRDLLYSQNYVSHLGIYRRELVRKVGGFRAGFEGSQDYDLVLRCLPSVSDAQIVHIPRVLYHWRASRGSTALSPTQKSYSTDAGTRALQEHFDSEAPGVIVEEGAVANTYRARWPIPDPAPLVSLVIPTRDRRVLTETCVRSILEKTTYSPYEILIIDNGSVEPDSLEFFRQIQQEDSRVRVIRYDAPFNYSAINNHAVTHCRGTVLGLVNNDIEVIDPGWLTEMASHVLRPDIGCVGAKLYYSNDTIQHAGVIVGLGGVAGHSHKHYDRHSAGYFHRLVLIQNLSAVTAACLLVRREVFEAVGGLDAEALTIAFNDVDFCLKVQAKGFRNLWTPYAELYHHESVSRGTEDNPEKQRRFQNEIDTMKQRWKTDRLYDPFYSPNLTRDAEDFSYRGFSPQHSANRMDFEMA